MKTLTDRAITKYTFAYIALILVWFPVQLLHTLHPQIYWLQYGLRLVLSVGILCKYSGCILHLKRDTVGWLVPMAALIPLQLLAIFRAGLDIGQLFKCGEFFVAMMGAFLFFGQLKDGNLQDLRAALWTVSVLYAVLTWPMAIANWGSSYQNVLLLIGGRAETVQILFVFSTILLSIDYAVYGQVTKPVRIALLLCFTTTVLLQSGQGMIMFGLLLCVLAVNRWSGRLWSIANLYLCSAVIGILNILILTGLYQKLDPVTFVIEKILKKNVNLTGRTNIYPLLPDIVADSPWVGFGYASDIVKERIAHVNRAYVNAHNTLAELVILFGILGSVLLLFLVVKTLKKNYRHCGLKQHAVLIGAIWICFIGGLVNIMTSQLAFWWLMAFAYELCRKTERVKNGEEYERKQVLPNSEAVSKHFDGESG